MIFTLSFIGFTLDVLGKLLIAWVTLRLHIKHFKTHHVNKDDIRLDAWMSTIGILMIAVGYFLRVPFELSIPAQF